MLRAIKDQRYCILIDVYTGEELDMIDYWIEKIEDGNKLMETLHEKIHRLKDKNRCWNYLFSHFGNWWFGNKDWFEFNRGLY